jgi:hypothetical protein
LSEMVHGYSHDQMTGRPMDAPSSIQGVGPHADWGATAA